MIPQNLVKQAGKAFNEKESRDPNKSSGGGLNSLFFSPAGGLLNGESYKYELLIFSPSYLLQNRKSEFVNDPLLSVSFPIDMHAFRFNNMFFPIPCKKQTVKYSFINDNISEDENCPVCDAGYHMKRKYWDELNPLLKQYGNWQHLPDDIQNDMKEKNQTWKSIVTKKVYDYIPCIPVKITGKGKKSGVELPKSIVWIKAPMDLMKAIKSNLDDGEYIFAEDYTKSGDVVKSQYTPAWMVKVVVEKSDKGFTDYSIQPFPNSEYQLKVTDEGVIVNNESREINNLLLETTDLFGYYENIFSDWENKTKIKEFYEALGYENGIEEMEKSIDSDSDDEYDPNEDQDEDVEIDDEEFDKF